jgi:hypothetical protein
MIRSTILLLLTGSLSASAGEISDFWHVQPHQTDPLAAEQKSRTLTEVESTNHGITEIGIERTGSVRGGPIFTFIVKSDGTFRYMGEKEVERTGEYTGTFPVGHFHQLAQFIRDSGYMGFENEYRREVTDRATTYTMVVMDGQRKVIRNYANTGPTALWAVENLIDDLMAKSTWKDGLPLAPGALLPSVTRYDPDLVLRAAYLTSCKQGYRDAWDRKEKLPVFAPKSDADKARVLGYSDGMVAGRLALAKWSGTNAWPSGQTSSPAIKR